MCTMVIGGKKASAASYDFAEIPVDASETEKYLKFTMAQAGYARLSVGSNNITPIAVNIFGNIENVNVYANPLLNNLVLNGEMGAFDNDSSVTQLFYLEAGTYYIKLNRDSHTDSYRTGVITANVTAQYVTNVRPSSYDKAATLRIGTETKGFLTDTFRKQYYKLVLPYDATVSIDHRMNKTSSGEYYQYAITVCDSRKKEIKEETSNKNNTTQTTTLNLKKGTYYIAMGATSKYYIGESAINVTATKKDFTAPQKPTVSTYKKNTTVVKGKGEKNQLFM